MLIEGGQRYFMIMIDDTSRYCHVYLLKIKDEDLNCFKIYKVEVKNQLDKKIKRLCLIEVKSISLMSLTYSV
jgi:hypothetical protein